LGPHILSLELSVVGEEHQLLHVSGSEQQAEWIERTCFGIHNVLGRSRKMEGLDFSHYHHNLENVSQDYEIGQAASQGKEKE
jgi:hypothetical protein